MGLQTTLTSDHVAGYGHMVEFCSVSSETRRRKKERRKKQSLVKYKSADMYVGRPNDETLK